MSYRNRILWSSIFGLGLESIDIMMLSFTLTSIMATFGLSGAQGGMISTVTNIGMLLGGITFGLLADKYGRIKIFSYSILLFSIATALIGFSPNIWWVAACRFLAGVGGGGEFGVGMAMLVEAFPRHERGKANSYVTIGGQVGAIIAALLAYFLLPVVGWRGLFIFGIVPVFLAVAVRYHLPETPQWLAAKEAAEAQGKSLNVSLSELVKTPRLAWTTVTLIIMSSVQVSGYFGLMTWLPSILQKQLGLTISCSALWTISTIVGMCLGMLLFGRFMDSLGAKKSYGIFLLCSAVSVLLYAYANSGIAILLGGAVVGFFANGMNAGYGTLISSFYPPNIRATANNTIFNIGRAIGGFSPIAIGYLLQYYTIGYAMLYFTALYLISFAVMLTLKRDPSVVDAEEML